MDEAIYKITNWLREPAFETGLKIYQKHGKDDYWKSFLESLGRTSITENKLIELMKQLLEELQTAPKQVQYVVFSPKQNKLVTSQKIRASDSPDAHPDILKLVEERKLLWREAYSTFSKITLINDQEERLNAAKLINENWRRILKIWVITAEYDDDQTKLPQKEVKGNIIAKDINNLYKTLCYLRQTRSKIKAGRLRQFSVEEPTIDKLAQIEADIDEIEHLLELAESDYEFIQE